MKVPLHAIPIPGQESLRAQYVRFRPQRELSDPKCLRDLPPYAVILEAALFALQNELQNELNTQELLNDALTSQLHSTSTAVEEAARNSKRDQDGNQLTTAKTLLERLEDDAGLTNRRVPRKISELPSDPSKLTSAHIFRAIELSPPQDFDWITYILSQRGDLLYSVGPRGMTVLQRAITMKEQIVIPLVLIGAFSRNCNMTTTQLDQPDQYTLTDKERREKQLLLIKIRKHIYAAARTLQDKISTRQEDRKHQRESARWESLLSSCLQIIIMSHGDAFLRQLIGAIKNRLVQGPSSSEHTPSEIIYNAFRHEIVKIASGPSASSALERYAHVKSYLYNASLDTALIALANAMKPRGEPPIPLAKFGRDDSVYNAFSDYVDNLSPDNVNPRLYKKVRDIQSIVGRHGGFHLNEIWLSVASIIDEGY